MQIVNEVWPLLDGQFMAAIGVGLMFYFLSTRCQAVRIAERLQFVGFCSCATGSFTIIQTVARIYRH